ncbi:MAG: TIGR03905 family TSCPD domain-containing protein [Phocaeicola sp.]
MELRYKTTGTCSTDIEVEVVDNVVKHVSFWGGCNGNLQGIARLVEGMQVEDVLAKLEGIRCGRRSTSCPQELCKALRQLKEA